MTKVLLFRVNFVTITFVLRCTSSEKGKLSEKIGRKAEGLRSYMTMIA